jgi:hypothetical protein
MTTTTTMTAGEKSNPMAFICPKELDILPPRPVLFPWIPPMENLNLNLNHCCGGGTKEKKKKKSSNNRFSFDLGRGSKDKDASSLPSSQPGTPVTLPMSPSELSSGNNDDDIELGIPDMSSTVVANTNNNHHHHITTSVGHYQTNTTKHNQQQAVTVSLEDVIAQVLRVLFVFLSMKRAVLGEGSGDEEERKQRLADTFRFRKHSSNSQSS